MLTIPISPTSPIKLFTVTGLQFAKRYSRVVIGERGAYIEFNHNDLIRDSVFMPSSQTWRINSNLAVYNEWRTTDDAFVKLYDQKKKVEYADYLVTKWYVSPADTFIKRIGDEQLTPCEINLFTQETK